MKVCHLAQLVLPTVYNSPIYTSILHALILKIGDIKTALKARFMATCAMN